MKKKFAALAIAATALLGLTACGSGSVAGDQEFDTARVQIEDGRSVLCVLAHDTMSGGTAMSCDWATAR